MGEIRYSENRILKLANVLKNYIVLNQEQIDLNIVVEQMKSYIKAKGSNQIGPIVQYIHISYKDNNEVVPEIIIMLQCNNYIHNVEPPYSMESVVRVPNCMYCRYIGSEDKLKFAYDKIHLEAFENDVELEDCSYTIFVDRNEEDETIVADVFIPRKDGK